jgi:hypothetical protein
MLASCFMLVSYVVYSSALKMEMICTFEKSVDIQRSVHVIFQNIGPFCVIIN